MGENKWRQRRLGGDALPHSSPWPAANSFFVFNTFFSKAAAEAISVAQTNNFLTFLKLKSKQRKCQGNRQKM
jgi:hypothetical protein